MKKNCFAIKNINTGKFIAIPSTSVDETDDITYVKFYSSSAHAKKAFGRLNDGEYVIVNGTITFNISNDVKKDIQEVKSIVLSEKEQEIFNDE